MSRIERVFYDPEDYHGLGEGRWQDYMLEDGTIYDKSEHFCDTHSLPTEAHPLREPVQTEKFIQRCRTSLQMRGIDPDGLTIESVDLDALDKGSDK